MKQTTFKVYVEMFKLHNVTISLAFISDVGSFKIPQYPTYMKEQIDKFLQNSPVSHIHERINRELP